MKNKRIAIQLPLPSLSMQSFLEKLLKDEDFFALALENPLNAAEQCGLNLEIKTFTPTDFANFFGAIAGLKEALKDADQKAFDFENIFGKPAEIRGSILEAERHQGFLKEWDNRDAFRAKEMCHTTNRYFERDRGKLGRRSVEFLQNKLADREITSLSQSQIYRDLISVRIESSETNNHTRTEWNTDTFMQSDTRSDSGVDKNFETDGISFFEEHMHGPLINPIDLASVSARLETFTQMIGNKM